MPTKSHKPTKGPSQREVYYHAFVNAPIATLICDPWGNILEANTAFAGMLGYADEELIDMRLAEITHPADMTTTADWLASLQSGEETAIHADKRYIRKDGSVIWGSISAAMARDEKGDAAFIISQIKDITRERREREKLEESEVRLKAILDNSEAVVYAKDLTGCYLLANDRFCQIFGLTREQVLGKNDYDLFSEESAQAFTKNDHEVIVKGTAIQFEEQAPQTDGLHTYVSSKFPLRNSKGVVVAVCGISTDITQRKQAEIHSQELNEQLHKANEELKSMQLQLIQAEKLESVGTLAAGVAHEVKNPLALLLLGVEYLRENAPVEDPNIPVILEDMEDAILRAEKIIHGMVDFSADRQLQLRKIDVNEVIRGAETLVKHEFTLHNIEVINELSPVLPKVLADEGKLEQVLVNLMINAVHAMLGKALGRLVLRSFPGTVGERERDEGARTADRLRSGDEIVCIEIEDSGPGIPDEILPKIFDPFFTTKPTGVGTGLGLSVVKKIIELHKGIIKIENRPPAGACIQILLRAQPNN